MVRLITLTLLSCGLLLLCCVSAALAEVEPLRAVPIKPEAQWVYMVRLTTYLSGQAPKQWDISMLDTWEGSIESVRFRGQTVYEEALLFEQIVNYPEFVRIQPPNMIEPLTISYNHLAANGNIVGMPAEQSVQLEDGRTITTRIGDAAAHYARLMGAAQQLRLAELDFYLYFEDVDELSIEVWRRPARADTEAALLAPPPSVEEWLKSTTVAPAFDPADPQWIHLASYRGAYVAEDLQWLRPDGSSSSGEEEVAGGQE